MYNHDEPLNNLAQSHKYYEFQRKQERYFKRLKLFLILVLVAVSCYLFDQRPVSLSVEKAILALGIIWLGLVPSLQYLSDQNRPPMPFFPLVGLFYATCFGLPMFASGKKVHYVWSLTNVSEEALLLTLLGVALMNVAFYTSKFSWFKKLTPIRLPQFYKISKLIGLLWFFLVSHIAFLYIPFINEIPSVGQLLEPVGYIAYGMFYVLWRRKKLPVIQVTIICFIFLPLEILKRLISGLLSEFMLFGLFIVLVMWVEQKRLPVFIITINLAIYLILSPVKAEFRSLTWVKESSSNLNMIEKIELFLNLATKQIQHDKFINNNYETHKDDYSIGRWAHILSMSEVVKDTPQRVPYWGGQSYLPLLTSFIPRAIFPDKVIENTGNRFGRRYKYLDSNDFTTSFNLPWIVELYANFGDLGVLIGMSGVGILLAFLEQKLNRINMNPLEFVIGTTILFKLVYQESNFSLMVGGIITLYLCLYLIFKFFLNEHIR